MTNSYSYTGIDNNVFRRKSYSQLGNISKGEAFAPLKNLGVTFDYAVPQPWLDDICKPENLRWFEAHLNESDEIKEFTVSIVLGAIVWAYPDNEYSMFGCPVGCTHTVQRFLEIYHFKNQAFRFEEIRKAFEGK